MDGAGSTKKLFYIILLRFSKIKPCNPEVTALMLFGSSPAVREKVVQLVLEMVDNEGPFAKKGLSRFLEAYACALGDGGTQSIQEYQ